MQNCKNLLKTSCFRIRCEPRCSRVRIKSKKPSVFPSQLLHGHCQRLCDLPSVEPSDSVAASSDSLTNLLNRLASLTPRPPLQDPAGLPPVVSDYEPPRSGPAPVDGVAPALLPPGWLPVHHVSAAPAIGFYFKTAKSRFTTSALPLHLPQVAAAAAGRALLRCFVSRPACRTKGRFTLLWFCTQTG